MYGPRHSGNNLGAQMSASKNNTPFLSKYQENLSMPIEHERLGVTVMCVYLRCVSANLVGATYDIAKMLIGNSPGTKGLNLRTFYSYMR